MPLESSSSLIGLDWKPRSYPDNLGENLNYPNFIAQLLFSRDVPLEEWDRFLNPKLSNLPDPSLIKNSIAAAQKIISHLQKGSEIIVYGDFDVDGTCSTALFIHFFRLLEPYGLKAKVSYYIPERVTEGYGLNPEAVESFAEAGLDLLITVDCGVSNFEEIKLASELGMDVVVIDHHQVSEEIPKDAIIVNPHQSGDKYPFSHLCAGGVSFNILMEIRRQLRSQDYFKEIKEPDLRQLLDLVALATVADVMPLQNVNRIFVKNGLMALKKTKIPGLLALLHCAKKDLLSVTEEDFGFVIGPRINASGRIEHAQKAVDLLLSNNFEEALPKARELEILNKERREIQKNILKDAIKKIESFKDIPAGIVLSQDDWHQGVLGIVAGKLRDRYHRPAILLCKTKDGYFKGSGRSLEGFDIFKALSKIKDKFLSFGGHPMAVGMSINADQIDGLNNHLALEFETKFLKNGWKPSLSVDIEADLNLANMDNYQYLSMLAPFGKSNPPPIFFSRDLIISELRLVGGSHLRFKFTQGESGFSTEVLGIAFGFGEFLSKLKVGQKVDVAWILNKNQYKGFVSAQMMIQDIRV